MPRSPETTICHLLLDIATGEDLCFLLLLLDEPELPPLRTDCIILTAGTPLPPSLLMLLASISGEGVPEQGGCPARPSIAPFADVPATRGAQWGPPTATQRQWQ